MDRQFQKTMYTNVSVEFVPSPCLSAHREIVVFHGHPNPHEALAGYRSPRPQRNTLPTRWIEELWKQM